MTSIKKDKRTGKYYFVYSGGFHPVTGKRIQKKRKGIHSLKEAKEELKRVIIEVEQEKNSYKADKSSFGNFAEKWFESKRLDFDQVQSSITASSLITTYFHI